MTDSGQRPPDGWVHTPLPPARRGDGPDGRDTSWFARNGVPVTLHDDEPTTADEPVPEPLKLTRLVLWATLVFALCALAAVLYAA